MFLISQNFAQNRPLGSVSFSFVLLFTIKTKLKLKLKTIYLKLLTVYTSKHIYLFQITNTAIINISKSTLPNL
jgi:hypothetical protein